MSLMNLGDISKPASALIEKISAAVGGLLAPWQIKRVARAEAAAELIKAEAGIEIDGLRNRAIQRLIVEEASRQENIEQIAAQAIPMLDEKADPTSMDDDWISNFFEKARRVSSDDMQTIWSRILAGEANAPGSFSRRTVNYLDDLDRRDAHLFQALCGFGWHIGTFRPLVFDEEAEIYNTRGITFASLKHLAGIGLLDFNSISAFSQRGVPELLVVSYQGRELALVFEGGAKKRSLNIGKVLLTQVGQELSSVCSPEVVDGFFEYVQKRWEPHIVGSGDPGPGE